MNWILNPPVVPRMQYEIGYWMLNSLVISKINIKLIFWTLNPLVVFFELNSGFNCPISNHYCILETTGGFNIEIINSLMQSWGVRFTWFDWKDLANCLATFEKYNDRISESLPDVFSLAVGFEDIPAIASGPVHTTECSRVFYCTDYRLQTPTLKKKKKTQKSHNHFFLRMRLLFEGR